VVLYGAYPQGRAVRGDPAAQEEAALLVDLARHGWGTSNPAFRRVFATLFFPDATHEQYDAFDELQRVSATPDVAARLRGTFNTIDVRDAARQVTAPTLVLHARDDGIVSFEQGATFASLIPGARFVPLASRNHILLEDEPAWATFLAEVRAFLPPAVKPEKALAAADGHALASLTEREREVLSLVADGLSNAAIAERLVLSGRTIERHLSNIYTKLGVEGKAARAAAAARLARGG
jgi:DNA-binding CsgD family transcriptional regulator